MNIDTYFCEVCNYKSNDRRNYFRHLKSKKHVANEKSKKIDIKKNNVSILKKEIKKSQDDEKNKKSIRDIPIKDTKISENNQNGILDIDTNIICELCLKEFKFKNNYYRHKKNFHNKDIEKDNEKDIIIANKDKEILSLKLEQEKRINQILSDMLTNANIIVNKTTNLANNAQNVTMSALNYANKIYKDAPYLKPIENFKIKNLDYDINNEKTQLIETILYHARTNSLDKLLGDHIVKHYKTDDPAEQMFHSTDVARLSYIVKQLIEEASEKNNYIGEDEWQKDPSGKEICKHIIDPLNKKIIEILGEYQKKLFEKNPLNLSKDEKETMKIICEIIIDEEIGTLSTNINKYIAPFFNLKKKEIIKDSDKKI